MKRQKYGKKVERKMVDKKMKCEEPSIKTGHSPLILYLRLSFSFRQFSFLGIALVLADRYDLPPVRGT
jgi:hypothetical protein